MVIEGKVTHGRELGRKLGFPTANIDFPSQISIENGVYRSKAEIGGVWHHAISNIGYSPSVGGQTRRLETHVFGFTGNLYGRDIKIELLEKIRNEQCFDSLDELRHQIRRDKEYVMGLLNENTNTKK